MSITDFNATWNSAGNENLDAYLEATGCPKEFFDVVKSGTLTYEFSQSGDTITVKSSSTSSGPDKPPQTNTFKFGQEFEEVGVDGQKRKAVVTFAGGKLTYNYPDFNGKGTAGSMVKEVSGGKLTETVSLGSVTAKVFYTK
ncbi:fatty acid-binding protein 2, liver-like [Branchiostoma floridae x Branchiostoma japonicum]